MNTGTLPRFSVYSEVYVHVASPPINPTPRLYLRVLWIRTLPWVTWEAVTVVQSNPDEGCYDTSWLTGPWSTQAKVEGIVPKAAWHWGRHSSVVNDSLGEPGRTQFYVCLPSVWGSVDGNQILSPFRGRAPYFGL
jgi:hypothetical protein